jgi:hypothetical protein
MNLFHMWMERRKTAHAMNDSELRHVAYEWANFHGTQGEVGFILLQLLYRSHDFYPVAALFTAPHGIDRIT